MTDGLPSGRVTFLFTDIEGSTRLFQRLGDSYPALLAEHNRFVRGAVAYHGGHEVKTEGDAFFVAFAKPEAAIAACLDAQRALLEGPWPPDAPIRVRMGVHTGTAEALDGDYIALAVHQAARVAAAGHGGQVIVSEDTAGAARGRLPADATLLHLGAHLLKDFDEPCVLFQLAHPELGSAFPPLRVPSARRENLPAFRTSLVGREVERRALAKLVHDERLVTVTGPGGVGKTRLAIAAGKDVVDGVSGGVWFVDLLRVDAGDAVDGAIGRALGVRDVGDAALDAVCQHLIAAGPVVLVLDNCEHVIEPTSVTVEVILDRCPDVRVLATSRIPLGVYGERFFRVSPLAEPESVQLFADRVRQVRPELDLDAHHAIVSSICRQLDGIPLAIELAAARARGLDLVEIARRLDDRFTLLASRARGGHARKESLREVIDWSYDLLAPAEQDCLRRLGVFVEGFALDAAEAVVGPDAADHVGRLVEHSLVEFGDWGHVPYRMLDSIRAYALDRLHASGDAEECLLRQRAFYLDLVERAAPAMTGPDQVGWYERLARERGNLATALATSESRGDAEELLRTAVGLGTFWLTSSDSQAAQHWLRAALAMDPAPGPLHRSALVILATTASALGERDEAVALAEQALAEAALAGDDEVAADAEIRLSAAALLGDDVDGAEAHAERALARSERIGSWLHTARAKRTLSMVYERRGWYQRQLELQEEIVAAHTEHGDVRGMGSALSNLATTSALRGDFDRARALFAQALELQQEVGDRHEIAYTLCNMGYQAMEDGDLANAVTLNSDALAIAREIGHASSVAFALNNLAESVAAAGDRPAAEQTYRECLELAGRLGETERVCFCIDGLGGLALERGEPALAVRAIAAADALRARHIVTLQRPYMLANERLLVACRAALGPQAFGEAWQAGRALTLEEIATQLMRA